MAPQLSIVSVIANLHRQEATGLQQLKRKQRRGPRIAAMRQISCSCYIKVLGSGGPGKPGGGSDDDSTIDLMSDR